jgi:hypothetical protein
LHTRDKGNAGSGLKTKCRQGLSLGLILATREKWRQPQGRKMKCNKKIAARNKSFAARIKSFAA